MAVSVNDSGQRACPVCGALVNYGDRFCPSCGSPQEWAEQAAPRPTEPGRPPAEPDPWLVDTRPTPSVPPYQPGGETGAPYSQAAWTPPPQAERRNNRTWWILGGIFVFFILVCCCCAALVFVSASQDSALREDLEGTANLLLALRATQ